MNKNLKTTCLYGIIKPNSEKKHRMDDSRLFEKDMQYAVLLKKVKVFFGNNNKGNKTLLGLQNSYINYIDGKRIDKEYEGGEKIGENIEIKELNMEENEYIKNFEMQFNDYITYIKIITSKEKSIEFGERPEKLVTILNFEGENMIQFFWGDYDDEGISAIGFKYTNRKNFIFGTILPILKLRYKFIHDNKFKNRINKEKEDLLKDNESMEYLYRACLLPDTCFSRIIKYC